MVEFHIAMMTTGKFWMWMLIYCLECVAASAAIFMVAGALMLLVASLFKQLHAGHWIFVVAGFGVLGAIGGAQMFWSLFSEAIQLKRAGGPTNHDRSIHREGQDAA